MRVVVLADGDAGRSCRSLRRARRAAAALLLEVRVRVDARLPRAHARTLRRAPLVPRLGEAALLVRVAAHRAVAGALEVLLAAEALRERLDAAALRRAVPEARRDDAAVRVVVLADGDGRDLDAAGSAQSRVGCREGKGDRDDQSHGWSWERGVEIAASWFYDHCNQRG